MGIASMVAETPALRLAVAVLIGALLGIVLSFLVNSLLVEVSLSHLMAFYVGLLLCAVGSLILVRLRTRHVALSGFALLVVVSGVLCFFFKSTWIFTVGPFPKALLYGVIGMSICFAVTFGIVDGLNACMDVCSAADVGQSRPALVESPSQVRLVLATSLVMGVGYGVFFGALDVGKGARTGAQLRHQLAHEERFCVPFGAALGALAAAANEVLRARQGSAEGYKYSPLNLGEDDDDDDDNLI